LDLKDGTEIVFYYNDASPVSSVDFSKTATDSPNFVTGGEAQHIRLWSTTFDEATFYLNDDTTFYLNDDTYTPVIFNAQYDSLLIARSGDHIYSFDQPIQQLDEIGPVKNSSHPAIAGNLEGNAFLISDFSGGVALWEETNGVDGWEQKWEEKIKSNFVTSLAFAPNGQYFLTATNRENTNPFGNYLIGEDQPDDARGFPAALRKVDDFSVVRTFGVSADQAIFSKDGKWVATNDESGLSVFNYKDAKLLFHVGINAPNAPMVICLAFAPNNLSIVAGYSNNVLQQFDLKGKLIREYKGHLGAIRSLAFSPNGKFLLSGSNDNSAKLWDVEKGSELATLMAIGKKDWLLSTPNGLFDASSGAMEQFYYVVGLEIISLDQLKDQYFEPGLLSKILLNEPTRKVENLENSVQAAFPKLLKSALINNVINVKTQARSGGIGKATISVDGNQEIIEDANPKRLENFSVNLLAYAKYFIPGEKNMLTLEIYSADGWSHSRSDTLYYTPAGPSGKGKPDKPKSNTTVSSLNDDTDKDLVNTLYALIVGTSDYKGETLDLKFPDLDAAAFADMVQKSGEELFGSDRVQVKMLSTAKKSTPPTKKAIRDALVNIAAKAEPKDILLVYFSGHGVTWPEKDPSSQFYYLSSDNSSFDFTNVANRQNAISQDSLQAWIRTVKARKRILILDACNSGDVIEKMDAGAKGNLSTDQRRALQRMQDRTGFFVLAGSSADKLSYEDPRFGHGLLTYSLLRNMPLVAAADKSNYVDINKLFQVVSEDVPKLAAAIQKNQEPKVIGREDFSIGIIKDVSKYKLPDAKKIITRSTFFNDKLRDPLKLSDVVNGQLETKLSDFTSAFIFYDTDKANSLYYSLNGKYEVNGTNVKATVYFYKGDQETELKTFTASGDTTQVKKLAEDLINQLYNFLATLK
jgi:WD40 repeat protein